MFSILVNVQKDAKEHTMKKGIKSPEYLNDKQYVERQKIKDIRYENTKVIPIPLKTMPKENNPSIALINI